MKTIIRKSIGDILILFTVVCMLSGSAEAKQLKVVSYPKTMQAGQRKTIKANQVVKWTSLNKNVVITTKKKAKKITICAKKKGTGVIVAQRGTKKIKLKIQVKAKPQNNTKPADNKEPQDDTEQKEITWEEALKNGGEVYIIGITGDTVEFATTKEGSLSKYLELDDTIKIIKDGEAVSRDCLQIGQCVKIDYEYHEDIVGGKLCGCKSITIVEKYWDGKGYIITISGDTVEFSVTKGGSLSMYLKLDDTIKIIKDGEAVSRDYLQVGQFVKVDYEYHEDIVGGRLWGCKSITIIK